MTETWVAHYPTLFSVRYVEKTSRLADGWICLFLFRLGHPVRSLRSSLRRAHRHPVYVP